MDKQSFYKELSGRLEVLGVDKEHIDRHLKQFDGFFDGKNDEEVEKEIEKLGDLDRVAARIKRMTDKIISAEKEEAKSASAAVADVPASTEKEADVVAEAPQKAPARKRAKVLDELNQLPDKKAPSTDFDDGVSAVTPDKIASSLDTAERNASIDAVGKKRGNDDVAFLDEVATVAPDDETIEKNRRKFWIIFAAVSPITLAALALLAGLFAFAFFMIAILIILSVAALVAITACGTLISVFGVIFGAAQIISSMPIGLYEIGLSIMIGSVAMFAGILVYNFAVRLMPLAARWLLVFMRFLIKKIRQLFVYLKKECIGL